MNDYLHPALDDDALRQMSALALAHMGDCVYEMMTRSYLTGSGLVTNRNLHRETIRLVCAGAQNAGAHVIEPMLTEEELAIYRHGRNTRPKGIPKTASPAEYAHATAVEALFGWLYLKQRYDRLNELFDVLLPAALEWGRKKQEEKKNR